VSGDAGAAESERLARSLGGGRWRLTGVAGSGKTLTLAARARLLRAEHRGWQILLTCFNTSLARALRGVLAPSDPCITVATFHDWAQAELEAAGVVVPPPPGRGALWDGYWTREVAAILLDAFDAGRIAPAAHQAILVDEGQDFVDDWYRALLRALDPKTDSLVVAVDPSQNIYRREIHWDAFGIGAAARTRVLPDNRRTPPAILRAARRMIAGLPGEAGPDADAGAGAAVSGGRAPEVRACASFDASREHALGWIRQRLAEGAAPGDVLLLGLSRLDMITVNAWLNSKSIAAWLPGEAATGEGIRVSTIHGAKGLEARSVLVLDAHQLDARNHAEARRLLYIAMTRARRDLGVTYFRDSPLMVDLARACAAA